MRYKYAYECISNVNSHNRLKFLSKNFSTLTILINVSSYNVSWRQRHIYFNVK